MILVSRTDRYNCFVADAFSPYAKHEYSAGTHNKSWANLFELIPEDLPVLDVGCFTGDFGAALIREKGCTVVGVDTNTADIAEAKAALTEAQVIDVTVQGALAGLGKFDVIVLELLPDPRASLRSLHSSLSPNGFVAFSIPHMGHFSVRLDLLSGQFPHTETGLFDRTHFHFYDRLEIDDLFAVGGYTIVHGRPVVVHYPDSWLRVRLAQLGLTADAKFFLLMSETESEVFQYVGTAYPTSLESIRQSVERERPMSNEQILWYVQSLIDERNRAQKRQRDAESRLAVARPSLLYRCLGAIRDRLRRH